MINGYQWYIQFVGELYATASAHPQVLNCIFENITGSAVSFEAGSNAGSSTAKVANTSMSQCGIAVSMADPFDVTVWNCLLQLCTNGVLRTGSLSSNVGYDCFYNNRTNFIGYPRSFGQIVMANRNGTPCDIANNIYQNPLLAEATNYTLVPNSPCIDAGSPDPAYLDGCFPPSQGTTVNDIGIYGGPFACGWLTNTMTTFGLTVQEYVGVTITPSAAGRYRLEYLDSLVAPPATNALWTQATNLMLLSSPFTYIDFNSPTNAMRFYRAELLP